MLPVSTPRLHAKVTCRRVRCGRSCAHDAVAVVMVVAALGAGPHRDHVARLGHLVADLAKSRGHLVGLALATKEQ